MEWATGVNLFGGTATIENEVHECTVMELGQLHDRGLPKTVKERHTIRVRLDGGSRTKAIPADLRQRLSVPDDLWEKQGLYKWNLNGRDYLVPALALMRAFFGPSSHLLAEMFRPQALERICYLDFDGKPPELRMVIRRGQPVQPSAREAVDHRLSWMLCYPSAHQMAGSIHRYGLQGRLDIRLPKATAYMEVAGVSIGTSIFVTRCRLMSLAPHEPPIVGVPATARFVMQTFRGHGCDVARHADGSIKLTDAEWSQIYALTDKCTLVFANPSSRVRLDIILDKLAQETAWKNVVCEGASRDTVIALHRTLTKHALLERILLFLDESRVSATTAIVHETSEQSTERGSDNYAYLDEQG